MKLSVGSRLFGQCAVAVMMCAFLGWNGHRAMSEMGRAADEISQTGQALRNHMTADMMHDALRSDVLSALLARTDADRKGAMDDLAEHSQWFRKAVADNEAMGLDAEVEKAIEEVKPRLKAYIKGAEEIAGAAVKDPKSAEAMLPAFMELFTGLEGAMEDASVKIEGVMAGATEHEKAVASKATVMALVFGGAASLLLIGVALWTTRLIVRPLRDCLTSLEACARSDLTHTTTWKSNDEFGGLASAINTLTSNFGGIIGEVQRSAVEVASAATQIASSATEMSAAVDDVAKQTARTAETAAESGRIAQEGGQIVRQTVDGMSQIEQAVTASAASVTELGSRGRQIGEIISTINDIADQTNLLALNAAIEAARAGEHGRGFAVVADEVRKLAERTSKATEEVGRSIQAIQHETEEAVRRMGAGTEQVKSGVERATAAGASLDQIVSGAGEVAGMVQSISAAAEEAGAGARQSAEAAAQLSSKSEQLQTLVAQFKIDGRAR